MEESASDFLFAGVRTILSHPAISARFVYSYTDGVAPEKREIRTYTPKAEK
jgi:hypothetical protein